jgi:hypothetical protein
VSKTWAGKTWYRCRKNSRSWDLRFLSVVDYLFKNTEFSKIILSTQRLYRYSL